MALRVDAPAIAEPIIQEIMRLGEKHDPGYRVILFNDDVHSMDEVVFQIQKATGYSLEKAEAIMFEAHSSGQAVVYCGDLQECKKVADVLMQINLMVSVETN